MPGPLCLGGEHLSLKASLSPQDTFCDQPLGCQKSKRKLVSTSSSSAPGSQSPPLPPGALKALLPHSHLTPRLARATHRPSSHCPLSLLQGVLDSSRQKTEGREWALGFGLCLCHLGKITYPPHASFCSNHQLASWPLLPRMESRPNTGSA